MTIPFVDLQQWFDGDDAPRAAFAKQVDEHSQRIGFLVVTNHGIASTLLDTCREHARSFFHQPDEVKAEVAAGDGPHRGWVGAGRQSHAATCVSVEQPARFEPVLAGDYLAMKMDELAVS